MSRKKISNYVLEPDTQLMISSALSNLISIPSVGKDSSVSFPYGEAVAHVLEEALKLGESLGFDVQNHDYRCGSIILRGSSQKEIGIITHLDVVPSGEGWDFPPYELTVNDGLYIGRGAIDNKGPTVAALAAMHYFLKTNTILPFTIRLLLGCNEERGMDDITYFLKSHPAPHFSFTPDGEFPVCIGEKGIAEVDLRLFELGNKIISFTGGNVSNAVADQAEIILSPDCELPLSFVDMPPGLTFEINECQQKILKAVGRSAHASMPENSINAIGLIANFLIANEVLERGTSQHMGMLLLSEAISGINGGGLDVGVSDDVFGKLTCICGKIYEKDGYIWSNHNIRWPMTYEIEELFNRIATHTKEYGVDAFLKSSNPGYYFDPNKKEVAALYKAYFEITKDYTKPYTMGGGTYARMFPNTVVFGSSYPGRISVLGPGRGGPHERDEYWSQADLNKTVEIFITALNNLASI